MTPAGVTCTCGTMTVTLSPGITPSPAATSTPSTMPYSWGLRLLKLPSIILKLTSLTLSCKAGSIPCRITPRIRLPLVSMTCFWTYGAAPTTCFSAFNLSSCTGQSASWPFVPETVTWATTPSILSRSSFSNPFMIDNTVIKTMTPNMIPNMEANDMNEIKRLRRRECV